MSLSFRTLVFASVLYMLLPALLFISGWVAALPAGIFFCLGIFLIYSQTRHVRGTLRLGKNLRYGTLAGALFLLFLWILLSGIGGCWYQNSDFAFRNAMIGDLINRPWPVIFPDGNIFNYYFSSFLPAAFCGKFGGEPLGQKLMAVWSWTGIALCFLWFLEALKTNRIWIILLIFIFWSGLDIMAIGAEKVLGGSHNDYKVSGMTVNFHHAIPAFLWAACLLHHGYPTKPWWYYLQVYYIPVPWKPLEPCLSCLAGLSSPSGDCIFHGIAPGKGSKESCALRHAGPPCCFPCQHLHFSPATIPLLQQNAWGGSGFTTSL